MVEQIIQENQINEPEKSKQVNNDSFSCKHEWVLLEKQSIKEIKYDSEENRKRPVIRIYSIFVCPNCQLTNYFFTPDCYWG